MGYDRGLLEMGSLDAGYWRFRALGLKARPQEFVC